MKLYVALFVFSDVNWNEYEVNDDAGAGVRSDSDVVNSPVVEETTMTQKEELSEVDHALRAQNSLDKTFDEKMTTEEEVDKEKDKSEENSSYQNTIAKVQGHNNDIVNINDENEIEGSSQTDSDKRAVEVELNTCPNHEYNDVYEENVVQSDTNENVRSKAIPHQNYDEVSFEKPEDANQSIHENNEDVFSSFAFVADGSSWLCCSPSLTSTSLPGLTPVAFFPPCILASSKLCILGLGMWTFPGVIVFGVVCFF